MGYRKRARVVWRAPLETSCLDKPRHGGARTDVPFVPPTVPFVLHPYGGSNPNTAIDVDSVAAATGFDV
jgi:hypothetical protein